MIRGIVSALAALPLALWVVAAGADEPILTDRPDFTETALAVSPGRLQLEGGFTVTGVGGATFWNAPEALVRWGLLRGAELRLGGDILWVEGQLSSGDAVDGYVGAKLELLSGGAFGLALIPALTIPDIGEDDVDPELVAAWSRALPSPWSLGGILGYTWGDEVDDRALTATLSVGRSIGGRLGTFLEWASETTDERMASLIHHGYTLGLGPDLQLDLHGGWGIDPEAPDYFVGAGLALRR